MEVRRFLDDRIKITKSCGCSEHRLDVYCSGLHPPLQTALVSFLPRSCGCLKRQEVRSCLGEKEQRQQGLTAELRFAHEGFLAPWNSLEESSMAARQEDVHWALQDSAAAVVTAALTAPNTMALVLTAATVTAGPALEALFFLVECQNFPEEWKQKKKN